MEKNASLEATKRNLEDEMERVCIRSLKCLLNSLPVSVIC